MHDFWKKYRNSILVFLLGATLLIGGIAVIALFSGALMKLFGFTYHSVKNILLFFVIATIISYPLNLIASALPKAMVITERVSHRVATIIYFVLDTMATAVGLHIVDFYMRSISATDTSILIVSMIFALLGLSKIKKAN